MFKYLRESLCTSKNDSYEIHYVYWILSKPMRFPKEFIYCSLNILTLYFMYRQRHESFEVWLLLDEECLAAVDCYPIEELLVQTFAE